MVAPEAKTPVDEFIRAARDLMSWIDDGDDRSEPLPSLARLLHCAMALPSIAPTDSTGATVREEVDRASLRARVAKRLAQDSYWMVLEPFDFEGATVSTGVGMISDDLEDIYVDLAYGFEQHERGETTEAIWHWRFSFEHHWGTHLVDLIWALQHSKGLP